MLHAKSKRIGYSELLSPPANYTLSRAIGTTYSLDLYALLAVPVAMFYGQSLDGDFKQDRYDVLEALRQCEEKVLVFCQADKIFVPKKHKGIFAFLENSIKLVHPPILNSSFHPKIWVLRFENEENDVIYRLGVLSRNLTFDQSWDISFYADGQVGKPNKESLKLSKYLQSFYEDNSIEKDKQFYNDLESVSFAMPDSFDSLEIEPILGFSDNIKAFPNPLLAYNFEKLIVISPFLDISTLKRFIDKRTKLFIFSRLNELQKVNQDVFKNAPDLEAYYMNTAFVEGASYIETEGVEPALQDLHAKIYIGLENKTTHWFLGSANFTDPAFTRNAEILLHLKSSANQSSFENVYNSLLDEKQRFFLEYQPLPKKIEEDDLELKKSFRKLGFELSSLPISAKWKFNGSKYDVSYQMDLRGINGAELELVVHPIHTQKREMHILKFEQINDFEFLNISLTDLSPFIVCIMRSKSEEKQLIVKTKLEIPTERNDAVFQEMIGNKLKFMEYLQFILTPNQLNNIVGYSGSIDPNNESNIRDLSSLLGFSNNLYEALLLAASRTPKRLKEIDKVVESIKSIDPEIVSDFMPIWEVYKELIHD